MEGYSAVTPKWVVLFVVLSTDIVQGARHENVSKVRVKVGITNCEDLRRTSTNKSQTSWQQSCYHETYEGSRQYLKGTTGTWAFTRFIKCEPFAHDLRDARRKNFDSKGIRRTDLVYMRCGWNCKGNRGFWRDTFVCFWHPKIYFPANRRHADAGCSSKCKSRCFWGILAHRIWLKSSKSGDLARHCCFSIITSSKPIEIAQVGFAKVPGRRYQISHLLG